MLRSRINYWSCSKLADWIRGEKKPFALELDAWDKWDSEQRKKRPIRFWLSDTFLTKAQNFFYFPYDIYREIRNYVTNRFITKTHYLKTGLKPGNYYELDCRIIHGLFNELVEFVEVEQAHLNKYCTEDKNYKFVKGRCTEAGMDYLNWAGSLVFNESQGIQSSDEDYGKPTPQAISAKKIIELYNWWKHVRPNRKEPMDISGWSEYCSNKENYSNEDSSNILKRLNEIESQQEEEDENMMIELIKIRKSLWT